MKFCKLVCLSILVMALAGCGNSQQPQPETPPTQAVEEQQSTEPTADEENAGDTQEAQPSPEASPETSPEPSPEPVPDEPDEPLTFITDAGTTTLNGYTVKPIPDNSAFEFVSGMGPGFNLGNAFDANDCDWLTDEMAFESAWCGARTTYAFIDSLCNEGFNVIRIPVSWHDHVDANYQISEPWLNRVTEIVDYCLSKDMYVIINVHHDIKKDYFYPDSAHLDNTLNYTETVWKQLAEHFKDRSNRLIFECINEPRLRDTNYEWWFSTVDDTVRDSYKALAEANQTFVDTVRATGGNNADRFLMVCGYCDMPSSTTSADFQLPWDTAKDRLIVTVHAYTPYSFAGEATGTTHFGAAEERENKSVFSSLYDRFVANGVPVIIGEYGATDKCTTEDRVAYYQFMGECSALYSIPLIVWDNNEFNNSGTPQAEKFGLIDRATGNVICRECVDAITESYK